jgi:hypothetical protein
MKWKGSRKEKSRPEQGTIQSCAWNDSVKPWKSQDYQYLEETQIEHLPKMSLEHYRHGSPRGIKLIVSSVN